MYNKKYVWSTVLGNSVLHLNRAYFSASMNMRPFLCNLLISVYGLMLLSQIVVFHMNCDVLVIFVRFLQFRDLLAFFKAADVHNMRNIH